ncbi:hypothetical protein ABI59_07710 [Acidobacteria bacterium Mor1]|nr:hypothetical protein ABI59_07710 [Acidobacteria bacterium Mor1]
MKNPAGRVLVAALILTLASLAGGYIGSGVQADTETTSDHLRTFSQILALVEDNYVGDTEQGELVEGAIRGLLAELDPHSNYLDPSNFGEMRDEQRGKFYGLGIRITKRGPDKPLTIITPIDGTPADEAGLIAGDVIFKIEGEETIDLTVREAVSRLKGEKGTKVTITVQRGDKRFPVTLARGEIPINSLRSAFMLDDTTGLIRISNFTSTTSSELDEAVTKLQAEGMKRLLLDLRGNPGGLLEQAVQVSERFIDPGKMVVYTRGRVPGSEQDYIARDGVPRLDMPVVVLVDHSSASASEIVSGAIQDHDRGLVVGETTFGKGLVQRVIPLRDGGALAVTTAKYYTPAGRLIQRDYSDLDDYYFELREDDPTATTVAPTDSELPSEVFYTSQGRKVYGGGGITPDYTIKAESASVLFSRIRRENLFFDFAVRYAAQHPELKRGFKVTDTLLEEFRAFMNEKDFEYEPLDFEESKGDISLQLRAQISSVVWDQVEESRVLAEEDPQIQKALEVFEEAKKLAERLGASDSKG